MRFLLLFRRSRICRYLPVVWLTIFTLTPGRWLFADGAPGETSAATEGADVFDADLDELFGQVIRSAPSKAKSLKLEPGLLTIITAEDIARLGARDLLDVLAQVPGFHLGVDVAGVLGLGYRGIWAHEGKFGLLVDGHPLQDLSYDNLALGDRLPVELIERIEIFRGPPGAALFGDYAQLGLINIVTLQPDSPKQSQGQAQVGVAEGTLGHARLSALTGDRPTWGRFPVRWLIGASVARANRSPKDYSDIYGDSYDMESESALKDRYFNGRLSVGDLALSVLINDYHVQHRDAYGAILSQPHTYRFLVSSLLLDYSKRWQGYVLSFKLGHQRQLPWYSNKVPPGEPSVLGDDFTGNRSNVGVNLVWDAHDAWLLYGGFDFQRDDIWFGDTEILSQDYFSVMNSTHAVYQRYGLYAQAVGAYDALTLSLGLRAHFEAGPEVVPLPRLALASAKGRWHGKWSASTSIRSPGAKNRDLNPNIQTEQILSLETEQGVKITTNLDLVGSAFATKLDDVIVYDYDAAADVENYINQKGNTIVGSEAQTVWQGDRKQARLGYGAYRVLNSNVPAFADPLNASQALGMAKHRVFGSLSAQLSEPVAITLSGALTSKYTVYDGYAAASDSLIATRQAVGAWASIYARYDAAFAEGLSIGFGIADLFDSQLAMPQPYDGYHAPLPTRGRELYLQVSYRGR